jgi:hypothetical protein
MPGSVKAAIQNAQYRAILGVNRKQILPGFPVFLTVANKRRVSKVADTYFPIAAEFQHKYRILMRLGINVSTD